ncbi:MAG: tetratricopeptide repeat protein [Deltaproteobacteria bacterium]|nr:tetratricopeptide repeat protein [Deltaproteobacteria bacterium]
MPPRSPWRWLAPLLLAVVTTAAYVNAAPKVLVYDDHSVISQNREFGGVRTIPSLFRKHARAGTADPSRLYRPVAMATLALDRTVYAGHARGYHVSSIAFHVLATLLLFGLLQALGVPRAAAVVAALVFGVHPLHTDAVDSVFNRSEVLATIGVLGALWWLWRDADAPRLRLRAVAPAAAMYFVALLCRESAATLPALAALMLALLRPRPTWAAEARRLAPLALLAVPLLAYLWLRQLALPGAGGGAIASLTDGLGAPGALGERLSLAAVAARDYLKLLVYPSPLRASYEDYAVRALGFAVALHVVLCGVAVATRRRAPLVAFAIACYYVALLPSTKVFADPAAFAERFAYLPSVALSLALAWALGRLAARHGSRPVLLAGVALCAALLPLTLLRNLDWHDRISLWKADLEVTDRDWRSLLNLSEAYLALGRNHRVMALCERGHQVAPRHGGFHSNRALALINLGRYDEAEAAFRAAIARDPRPTHWANLARFYALRQRYPESVAAFQRALAVQPDHAEHHALRGEMLLQARYDAAAARDEFAAALRIEPRLFTAREGLRAAERMLRRDAATQPASAPAATPAAQPASPPATTRP